VLAHRERLIRLARARVGDDADDVAQEAMLRCATFAGLDEERLGELLTSITVRLCADEHRRRVRVAHLVRRLPVDRLEEPGVDEPVCARAEAAWAAEVVRELPAMQQAIIAARAEGLSYDEISRRHRVTYKSAESAAARARAFVREAIAATLALTAFARRNVAAPAVVVSAAAVALVALGAAPAVRVDPMTAAPAVDGRALAATAPGRAPALARPVARAVPPAVRTPPRGTAGRAPAARPAPRPVVDVGKGGVGYDEHQHEWTTRQRVEHCVRYGVQIRPTIQCRYPDPPGTEPR
jgi:RNA polymerase sigma-70 factor (ECF subfamily)